MFYDNAIQGGVSIMEYAIYEEGILVGCFPDESVRDLFFTAVCREDPNGEYEKGELREDEA